MAAPAAAAAGQQPGYIGSLSGDTERSNSPTASMGSPKITVSRREWHALNQERLDLLAIAGRNDSDDGKDDKTRNLWKAIKRLGAGGAGDTSAEPSLTRTVSTSRSTTAPRGQPDYTADDTDTLTRHQAEIAALQLKHTLLQETHAGCAKLKEGFDAERAVLRQLIEGKDKLKADADAEHERALEFERAQITALQKEHAQCAKDRESFELEQRVTQESMAEKDRAKAASDEEHALALKAAQAQIAELQTASAAEKAKMTALEASYRIAQRVCMLFGSIIAAGAIALVMNCRRQPEEPIGIECPMPLTSIY